VGTISALVGKPDVIFSDAMNHASIIDGCRLSGARIVIYKHNDACSLRSALKEARSNDRRRRLIVTDTLFSMEGDAAPLPVMAALAAEFEAMLLVDEAHATGVFGAEGRGLVEQFQLEDSIPVRIGTLSKALGSLGGFVVGPQSVIEWISHAARPYFFSTAPPDALARISREALRVVQNEPQRRRVLLHLSEQLRTQLRQIGYDIGASMSQIVPVIVGDAQRAVQASARLLEQGVFVPAIRPPSVPEGRSLLRISLSCRHTEADIGRLVRAISGVLQPAREDEWTRRR
jgi:8-amino-7-oxononanoate synthase